MDKEKAEKEFEKLVTKFRENIDIYMIDFKKYYYDRVEILNYTYQQYFEKYIIDLPVLFIDTDTIKNENGVAIISLSKAMDKDEYYIKYDELCKKGVHWLRFGFLCVHNDAIIVICEYQSKIKGWAENGTRADIAFGGAFESDSYKIID